MDHPLDGYLSDESVVTNSTMNSADLSSLQLFKGLNMLYVSTQDMENLSSEEICCSPVIPSQIITAPIFTSQLTEPLFSDLTDDESSYSQSLLVTSTAKDQWTPGDQNALAMKKDNITSQQPDCNADLVDVIKCSSLTTELSHDVIADVSQNITTAESQDVIPVISQDVITEISQDVSANLFQDVAMEASQNVTAAESRDIIPVISQDVITEISQYVTANLFQDVTMEASQNVTEAESRDIIIEVSQDRGESQTDSDATRLESDIHVSPNFMSLNASTPMLPSQINDLPQTSDNATGVTSHNKLTSDTHDLYLSQISTILFPSEGKFNKEFKDDVSESWTSPFDKDKLCSVIVLDEKDDFRNKTACKKTFTARDSRITSKSFIPPYKKICMSSNLQTNTAYQKTTDIDDNKTLFQKAKEHNLLKEDGMCSCSKFTGNDGGHVNKCMTSRVQNSTDFKPSNNCDTIEVDFSKPSQVVTSVVNTVDYSQVSTMSSRSLFSSSIPSETQTSKPCDHVIDADKVELASEVETTTVINPVEVCSDSRHLVEDDRMCSSSNTAITIEKNMILHSLTGNAKTESLYDRGDNSKDSEIVMTVLHDGDLAELCQCEADSKITSVGPRDASDWAALKKYKDSSECELATSDLDAGSHTKPAERDKLSDINKTPLQIMQETHFKVRSECATEIPSALLNSNPAEGNSSEMPITSRSNFKDFRFMEASIKSPSNSSNNNHCVQYSASTNVNQIPITCKSSSRKSCTRSISSTSLTKSPRSNRCSSSNTGSSNGRKQLLVKHTNNVDLKTLVSGTLSKNDLTLCNVATKACDLSAPGDSYKKSVETEAQLKQITSKDKTNTSSKASQKDQSEEITLMMLSEQYTQILELLEIGHLEKTTFNSITQKTKKLQVKILKLSESHKSERTTMMKKIQKGSLSKSDKLRLKADMQGLAERQKLLVEIVQKHKEINRKLKSISLGTLSGNTCDTTGVKSSLDRDSNVSSSQMPISQQSSGLDVRGNIKPPLLEKLSGETDINTVDVIVGENSKSTIYHLCSVNSNQMLGKQINQADFNSKSTAAEVAKHNLITSGSLGLDPNSAQTSATQIKIDDVSSALNTQRCIYSSTSCHTQDKMVGRVCESSTDISEDHVEKLQTKTATEITVVKTPGELPSKISLCESSQKVLDNIFFTNRESASRMASSQPNNTEPRVSDQLDRVVCGSQAVAGNKLHATDLESQVITGNKLYGMSCEAQFNAVKQLDGTDCGIQVNARKKIYCTAFGTQVNPGKEINNIVCGTQVKANKSPDDSSAKQVVAVVGETTKDVQSTQTDNYLDMQKTKMLTIDSSNRFDQACKEPIAESGDRCVTVQLKRTQITDKNGKIIDVFVIEDSRDTSRSLVNNSSVKTDEGMLINLSESPKDNTENMTSAAGAKEGLSNAREITGVVSANCNLSEVKEPISAESPYQTVGQDAHHKQFSIKTNIQTPRSTGLLISPGCPKPSTFKSPPQMSVVSNEAASITSPCSTAVSSDVFPVSCTELVRRMKARRTLPCHATLQRQDKGRNTFKAIPVIPMKKPAVPVDPASSPCLKDLIDAGWVKPGHHVLSLNTKDGEIRADITTAGVIRGSEGRIFRTPCAWMSAVTGSVTKRKMSVYQQIHYLNKPLSELVKEMILSNKKTMMASTLPAARFTQKSTDSRKMFVQHSKPVKILSVKDKESQSSSPSSCLDEVTTSLYQRLHNCKVKLIDDAEIVHCPELTTMFWSSNFTNVKMSKNMWASVNCWS